jgi:hypothetical protein
LIIVEFFRSPVIKDKQVGLGELFENPAISPVTSCKSERGEQPGNPVVGDGEILAACFVAECAGKPAFANTGWPGDKKAVVLSDPVAPGPSGGSCRLLLGRDTKPGEPRHRIWLSGNQNRSDRNRFGHT